MDPPVWAKLACAVRAALDARGLQATGISGPGTSMGSSKPFLLALDAADSFKCIALISIHSWEATHLNNNGPQRMSHNLTEYAAIRARFDPDHKKLWVATE